MHDAQAGRCFLSTMLCDRNKLPQCCSGVSTAILFFVVFISLYLLSACPSIPPSATGREHEEGMGVGIGRENCVAKNITIVLYAPRVS